MSEKLPGCPDCADPIACANCELARKLEAEHAELERAVADLQAAVREVRRSAGRPRAPLPRSRR